MGKHHILIVEDQRDLARMLRAGLSSLGPDFEAVDVPSGEEALLVAKDQLFDVLVIDIHLPGMSGFELMAKFKARFPEVKVILTTGLTDHQIRKQIANIGADAFFFKPIDLDDMLEAVRRCLGLIPLTPPPLEAEEPEEPSLTVAERLALLRQELNALSATLIDDRGEPLAQAGDFPDGPFQESLNPALMAVFSASTKVSHLLEMQTPLDLFSFTGREVAIYMAHVGQAYALVVVAERAHPASQLANAGPAIIQAVADLQTILSQMGVPLQAEAELPAPLPEPEVAIEEPAAPDLEELFRQAATMDLNPEEVSAFWEMPEDSMDTGSLNADDLSYDQAHKLGFTPTDE